MDMAEHPNITASPACPASEHLSIASDARSRMKGLLRAIHARRCSVRKEMPCKAPSRRGRLPRWRKPQFKSALLATLPGPLMLAIGTERTFRRRSGGTPPRRLAPAVECTSPDCDSRRVRYGCDGLGRVEELPRESVWRRPALTRLCPGSNAGAHGGSA